jgi:hypothetical protein
MRLRTHPITDLVLTKDELRKLKKGHHIFKMANHHKHCIYVDLSPNMKNEEDRKATSKDKGIKESTEDGRLNDNPRWSEYPAIS